jgi:hypothetical protein
MTSPARWGAAVIPSYDAIAEEYAKQYFDELDGKPFDRARHELASAVREIHRVLQPAGRVLLTVHEGAGEVGRDEAFGKPVALVATLFSEAEMRAALHDAGFHVDEMVTRPPYELEYQSRRIYTVATRG